MLVRVKSTSDGCCCEENHGLDLSLTLFLFREEGLAADELLMKVAFKTIFLHEFSFQKIF